MELATGAAASILPYKQFKQQVPSASCGPIDIVLRTYAGTLVQPCGVAVVNVQHSEQTAKLPLYVVDQAGPPLEATRIDASHYGIADNLIGSERKRELLSSQ
ncbi:hypothetical protein HPB52_009532 [Rhipicephalus sanguineus]|uniref:Uncharacterized protein n=1 Tax=Rhipicephalus sanguineus TaxID=34632 RepID=A0A9D4QE84_RHISA|nr:hypothetical protein HPB52_009532 [Rhipicephalus sanguineus]